MKKFYTFKSIALLALAVMANVAAAQNLKLTSNGNPVENGAVIELPYVFEVEAYPEFNLYIYSYIWNPHFEVSTTSGEANCTVTLTSLENTSGFQLCWPDGCKFANPGQSITSTGNVTTEPSDLQIHKEFSPDTADEKPTEGGSIKLTVKSGSETIECTVICLLEEYNGVDENIAEIDQPTTYYTLEGIKVDRPTAKGMYIVRKGSKSKVMYKK